MGKLEATKKIGNVKAEHAGSWIFMENNCGDICESRSIESSIENNSSSSINSIESYSSSDLMEDASSNPPTSSSSSSSTLQNGPLFELSDLMNQLPLSCRRGGLSKYYEGKSQSFTCLTSVKSVEDLAKKISPYQIKKIMKPCKSYAGGLNVQKSDIRKKTSPRGSFLSRASNNNLSVQNL